MRSAIIVSLLTAACEAVKIHEATTQLENHLGEVTQDFSPIPVNLDADSTLAEVTQEEHFQFVDRPQPLKNRGTYGGGRYQRSDRAKNITKDLPDQTQRLAETSQTWTCDAIATFPNLLGMADVQTVLNADVAWTDSAYPQSEAMYNWSAAQYTWERMSTKFPTSSGYRMFSDNTQNSININDTIQGYLGDCWVLSTSAAIAEVPARIWNMFQINAVNNENIYSMKLYSMGVPISVVIDDFVPVSYSQSMFTKTSLEKEWWPVLLEKAFAKLHGTYAAIEGGWMADAGMALMGTGGGNMYWSSETADSAWTKITGWDSQKLILTMANYNDVMGLIGGHAYTLIGAYTLSNGARVLKIRNPWGSSEWTGAYGDSDPFWTANPADATATGWAVKNEGVFFMTVEDTKTYFYNVTYTWDPSNWKHNYWLASPSYVGSTGSSSYCGSTCKRTTFAIKSNVAQRVYLAAHVHFGRQYVEAACETAATSSSSTTTRRYHIAGVQGQTSWLFDDGYAEWVVDMTAGQTLSAYIEIDYTRPNMQKDFAFTAWGSQDTVFITESLGTASANYYVFGGSSPTPDPNPLPPPPPPCTAGVWLLDYNGVRSIQITNCDTRLGRYSIIQNNSTFQNPSKLINATAYGTCSRNTKTLKTTCRYDVKTQQTAYIQYSNTWISTGISYSVAYI